jgi:serine protease Do
MRNVGRTAIFLLVGLLGVLVGAGMVWVGLRSAVPRGAGSRQTADVVSLRPAERAAPAARAEGLRSPVGLESQDAITAAIAQVGPAVVNINTTYPAPARDPLDRLLRGVMGVPTDPLPPIGKGSGIIIDGNNGYVLTNAHVVRGAARVEVGLSDRRRLDATVVGIDPLDDIAVVAIPGGDFPSARLGSDANLPVGAWVIAIGNPFGYESSATVGVISAKGREIKGSDGTVLHDLLQTDAAINRGNSGGALVDLNGEVVGIPTAMIPYAQGIGFAVSVDVARQVAERLIATGKMPWLGISHRDIAPEEIGDLGLREPRGALVVGVARGGPAASAGIRRGDVIVRVGDQDVTGARALGAAVRSHNAGERVEMTVWRQGRERTLDVTLGEMPI